MTKASLKRGQTGPPQHVPTELLQQVNQEAEIAGRLSLVRIARLCADGSCCRAVWTSSSSTFGATR